MASRQHTCPSCHFRQAVTERCSNCGYKFAFRPTKRGRRIITDKRFLAVVNRASHGDTHYFTRPQFFSAWLEQHRMLAWLPQVVWSLWPIAILISILSLVIHPGLLCLSAPLAIAAIALGSRLYRRGEHPRATAALAAWQGAGRELPRLLEEPGLHDAPPEWKEPDIHSHGVESILVVQREILVDLFVKNGWHEQQRALVVCSSGYPSYLREHLTRLLDAEEAPPVYLLHDSDHDRATILSDFKRNWQTDLSRHEPLDLGIGDKELRRFPALRRWRIYADGSPPQIDALPWSVLSRTTADSLAAGVPFAALLAQGHPSGYASSVDDFG